MDYLQLKKFSENYPKLDLFLVDGFPDADFDDLTDGEVAKDFASRYSSSTRQAVIAQARRLLTEEAFPLDIVSHVANRYFETIDEAREWLKAMTNILEDFEG